MRSRTCLLATLTSISLASAAAPRNPITNVADVAFTARADGSQQRYLEVMPFGYSTNKPYPLMIFLHGHASDRWQITKGDQWKEIQAVCNVAARRRMILISPDYRAATSWMGPAAEADLVQIIQEQKTKRLISRTFLCGGSMGGTSVLIFTALHPELVDGVVSMNGTANMMEFAGFEEAIAASYGGRKGERPDEYRKRSPELMAARFGTMPVAFTAGGQDTVVPPQSVLRLSQELEKQNPGQVRMLHRENVGHSTSYEDAVAALDFVIERGTRAADAAELVRTLEPLSVRGVNYYPRETSWDGMWTKTPREVWEKDMALAESLNINTVRTFVPFSSAMEQAGLLQHDGAPTPAYLEKIETFLVAARKHGIRAILCFEFSQNWLAEPDAGARCRRALSAVVTAHREDGRVLLWDLMNEPEDDAKWTDGTRAYLRAALPLAKALDPQHLTTVGLTWRIDRLATVGFPDVLQYHEYSPKARLFQEGSTRVCQDIAGQRKVGGQRPLLIGEFGMNTARDPQHGTAESLRAKLQAHPGTEAEQARIYEIVLGAAEKERVAGVLSWCLHDYPIENPNESYFGLVRADGTLKPAALMLRDTFARWVDAVQ
jgi:pimeloyl-ACP methyl ester carboxylesterase